MSVRYRYALAASGAVVEVESLDPERRVALAPYRCLSCEAPLDPHLGRKNRWHFHHRSSECSPESYLHAFAKRLFLQTFERCRTSGTPFVLRRPERMRCDHFLSEIGSACAYTQTVDLDLTQHFDRCQEEVAIRGFRADVLLSSSRHPQVLLVEFAVTHLSEPEKLASGLPILEVRLTSEEDLGPVAAARIDVAAENVSLRPVKTHAPAPRCGGRCVRRVHVLAVEEDGRAEVRQETAGRVFGPGSVSGAVHVEVVRDPEDASAVTAQVRDAFYGGVPLRSCYVCRHQGMSALGEEVFCRAKRTGGWANMATGCDQFHALATKRACEQADRKNLAYLEARDRQWREASAERTAPKPERKGRPPAQPSLPVKFGLLLEELDVRRQRLDEAGGAALARQQLRTYLNDPLASLPSAAQRYLYLLEALQDFLRSSESDVYCLAAAERETVRLLEDAIAETLDLLVRLPTRLVGHGARDWLAPALRRIRQAGIDERGGTRAEIRGSEV